MDPRNIDWRVLQGAIAALVVSVALSAGVLGASQYFHNEMQTQYAIEKRKLNNVRSDYQRVDEEEGIIERFLPRYRALERVGIVGDERRLSWVEALREFAATIKLPSLSYEISARKPYQSPAALDSGVFRIHASEMRLQLGLLHEGDLAALLRALEGRAQGFYSVSECNLRRRSGGIVLEPTAENVTGECVLRWFTLIPPEAGEERTQT